MEKHVSFDCGSSYHDYTSCASTNDPGDYTLAQHLDICISVAKFDADYGVSLAFP